METYVKTAMLYMVPIQRYSRLTLLDCVLPDRSVTLPDHIIINLSVLQPHYRQQVNENALDPW